MQLQKVEIPRALPSVTLALWFPCLFTFPHLSGKFFTQFPEHFKPDYGVAHFFNAFCLGRALFVCRARITAQRQRKRKSGRSLRVQRSVCVWVCARLFRTPCASAPAIMIGKFRFAVGNGKYTATEHAPSRKYLAGQEVICITKLHAVQPLNN